MFSNLFCVFVVYNYCTIVIIFFTIFLFRVNFGIVSLNILLRTESVIMGRR